MFLLRKMSRFQSKFVQVLEKLSSQGSLGTQITMLQEFGLASLIWVKMLLDFKGLQEKPLALSGSVIGEDESTHSSCLKCKMSYEVF